MSVSFAVLLNALIHLSSSFNVEPDYALTLTLLNTPGLYKKRRSRVQWGSYDADSSIELLEESTTLLLVIPTNY